MCKEQIEIANNQTDISYPAKRSDASVASISNLFPISRDMVLFCIRTWTLFADSAAGCCEVSESAENFAYHILMTNV